VRLHSHRDIQAHHEAERKRIAYGESKFASPQERVKFASPAADLALESLEISGLDEIVGRLKRQGANTLMQSANTESVGLAAAAPFIVAPEAIKGYEAKWADANRKAYAYLEYDPVSLPSRPLRQRSASIYESPGWPLTVGKEVYTIGRSGDADIYDDPPEAVRSAELLLWQESTGNIPLTTPLDVLDEEGFAKVPRLGVYPSALMFRRTYPNAEIHLLPALSAPELSVSVVLHGALARRELKADS
jgi:hypothetical protein